MTAMIPAGEGPGARTPSPAGYIPCVICLLPISFDEYRTARCWTDPGQITCAAHAACLVALGETDLDLPPAA